MQKRKFIVALAAMLLLAAVLTLYFRKAPDEPEPVRIGYLPIYVDLPLFVASERGFFDKRGVTVELKRFASSPNIGTALLTGDVHVGASIAYSVVLSTESRDPGKLKIFIVDSETPENYLSSIVVLPDSGISSVAGLRGKKVGCFPGPTAVTFFKMILEKYGINPKDDVEFLELDVGSHLDALTSKSVDALFTYEPTGTQAVIERGAVKILPGAAESEIINPWQAGVWVVTSTFLEQRPADARKVMLALYDAVDFIRANPQEAKGSLARFTSIKPAIAQATPNIPFAKLREVDLSALQRHADILHARGVVSKEIIATSLLISQEPIQ